MNASTSEEKLASEKEMLLKNLNEAHEYRRFLSRLQPNTPIAYMSGPGGRTMVYAAGKQIAMPRIVG